MLLSQVKNRLFMGNIPKDLNKDGLMEALGSDVRGGYGLVQG